MEVLPRKVVARLRRDLRAEVGATEVYRLQARRARSSKLQSGLKELAEEEARHGQFLSQLLQENGVHPGRCLGLQKLGGKIAGFTTSLFGLRRAIRWDRRFEGWNERWYEEEARFFASRGDGIRALRFEEMARGEREHYRKLASWYDEGLS